MKETVQIISPYLTAIEAAIYLQTTVQGMPAGLKHSIKAKTPVVMLLVLLK